ncbi:MAG TPA: TIGR02757 family protein [Thermoanaerobaculia bacterium]|nr:TIGR02757 family protein [Thermoanaerobaculia bacterium]
MHRTPIQRHQRLHERLESLVATFDVSTISPDPLELVYRWSDPLDQEVAALIAAAFAYGRAGTVVLNIGRVLEKMSPSPYLYLAQGFSEDEARERFAGFTHRFQKTPELVSLLTRLSRSIREHHSLGELFRECYSPDDHDIAPGLTRYVATIIGDAPARERKGLSYLLTSPEDGSACKRMNLFLRWMVRREAPDLGLWTFIDPSKLVIPLDTHIHRISSFLGLNRRKSPDWKAARGVTDRLARFNASDPVRYDFAICRLGILDLCSRQRRREQCDVCLLNDVCRLRLR